MQTLFSRWNRWMRPWAGIVTLSAWSLCYAGYGATWYVSTNGNDIADGTNWATALLTISNAVARATTDGDLVLLSNGVHNIVATNITITNGITVQGVYGRTNTVVQRSEAAYYRLFILSNANAVLEGLELRNGMARGASIEAERGGAVWMFAGTIRDCNLVSNNAGGTFGSSEGGGGVYMTGGTIRDCNVSNNWSGNVCGGLYLAGSCLVSNCFIAANRGVHGGAGIYMTSAGALVTHCVINNNTNSNNTGGGGIYMNAGTARNCLIAGNRQTFTSGSSRGGGGVNQAGGALLNCTIAGNAVLSDNTGGGVWWTAGSITNTIIYGNTRGTVTENLIASALTTIGYSCAPELTNVVNGNITGDPDFLDLSGGNYRLAPGSPAIDSGTNAPALTIDLDGATRPQDGDGTGGAQWDMGAYEAQASTSGVLRCSFQGSPVVGMEPLTVVFQASVAGTNTGSLVYYWDVNGDGTNDQTRTVPGLTNVYAPGIYNVALTVSNSAGTNQRLKSAYVTAQALALYVATNGAHTSPFTNWAMAATNLASALALAGNGTTLTVTNGTYDCSGQTLLYATVLTSVNGRAATTLRNPPSSTARLLTITHTQAVVSGFTLTGGKPSESGGAVYMTAGTIRDCNLVSNTVVSPTGNENGGAVWISGGTIRDCNLVNNWGGNFGGGLGLSGSGLVSNCFITANMGTHGGGGIYMTSAGALVTHCVINNNTNYYHNGGGGINMSAGTVRNCLIAGNRTTYSPAASGYGGGIRQAGGAVLNCTIVSNQTSTNWHLGGGIYKSAGAVTNCIVWDNWRATVREDITNTVDVGYSDALELTPGVDGNISADPRFAFPATNNYRLAEGSPCLNAGANMPWMVGATDLDGNQRIWRARVDMGAYELPPSRGTIFIIP